eukprot:s938_g17.t1
MEHLRWRAVAIAVLAQMPADAAICGNWNETQCPTMYDGGCSCYWNATICAMNASDCGGTGDTGITSVGDNCTLTGGEVVSFAWHGEDTGDNWCNSCMCISRGLGCTRMACWALDGPDTDTGNDTSTTPTSNADRASAVGAALMMSRLFVWNG